MVTATKPSHQTSPIPTLVSDGRESDPSYVKEAPVPDTAALLQQMMSVLQDVRATGDALTTRLSDLESRVEQAEQRTPRTQTMRPDLDVEVARRSRVKGDNVVETEGQKGEMALGPTGRPLREDLARAYQPRFRAGDIVYINPDSTRRHMPLGMTWAERLADKRWRSDGLAKVLKRARLERYDSDFDGIQGGFPVVEWRYRVYCANITGHQGDDFDEHELLPA